MFVTKEQVQSVLDSQPDLTANGFDPERKHDYKYFRAYLTLDHGMAEINRLIPPLLVYAKKKSISGDAVCPYCLKHDLEASIGFTTNGSCIVAAILAGFRIQRIKGSVNCWTDIDLNTIDPDMLPFFHSIVDGALALPTLDTDGSMSTLAVVISKTTRRPKRKPKETALWFSRHVGQVYATAEIEGGIK